MHGRRELGQTGEDLAAAFLQKAGYRIIDRNVRSRYGEIDLVALDKGCVVFVEVRTRRSMQFGPEESVTRRKQERLARLGAWYLKAHRMSTAEWRGDVVAIEMDQAGQVVRLNHIINAVEEL